MESHEGRKEEIRILVESMLTGSAAPADVLKQWPSGRAINIDEEYLNHEIGHFANDSDIRSRDKDYEEYQRNQISTLLKDFLES